ncbi:MAG: S1/P1 nuclease [Bryobacterales bacterium]|nr:S1/P1 nuclease [Bryobacterales bacterium]
MLAVLLFLSPAVFGWNATGHRIAAAIAYDHLTPAAKQRVDALLEKHPDYATLFIRDAPAEPEARARAAFLAASVWPDVIRGDSRFYDDTRENAKPTPLLPGFPYMARHTNWHYIDIPFSPDGAALEAVKPPNALTELRRILKEINQPGNDLVASYDLPWLIHLEGDVHQPLHCTSRFVQSQPKGDAGGNNVFVTPGRNLHALWDDAAGSDASDAYVNRFAAEITAEFVKRRGRHPRVSKDPKRWVREGFELAKSDVYTFGSGTGSREHPLALPEQYFADARRVARRQLALAGFRLAAILNEQFK